MVILTGCQEPMKMLLGSYSYKTSGTVEISGEQIVLPNESGALEVQKESESALRLVFNQMGGGVYMTTATLKDDVLTLDTLFRTIQVGLEPYDLAVVGTGNYHDGIIIFDLQYNGTSMQSDSTLLGKDILMVAKK